MTQAQKRLRELRDQQSRDRQRMAEISQAAELNDELRSELDDIEKGTPDLERQIRAATAALSEEERQAEVTAATHPDAEMRERIELRAKASLTSFFQSFAQGRVTSGAEAELQSAAGISGTGIPIELWDIPVESREDRAITPSPGTVGVNLDPIRPAVFASSIAPRLGIDMPRVMTGTYATGTITTSATAEAKGKGAEIEATAGAITVSTATPKRVSARLELQLEDIAAVGQENFESILRENLSLVLSDELDNQAINGDGTSPNLTGMLERLDNPDAPSNAADFDAFAAAHADAVDGLWASQIKDVGIVCGPATYSLSAKTFQSTNGSKGELSAAAYAMRETGGWWTNKRMPDAASNVQQAILHRKGRMGLRTAVCPHWGEVSIDDIYSGAKSAERSFTLHVLLGDVILVQPDAYAQVAYKLA